MKNQWMVVVRDAVSICLAVYLVGYVVAFVGFPRNLPFFYVWAIFDVSTAFVATIGFCLAGCFSPDRRRWHLPRVLGLVWFFRLLPVVLAPRESLGWVVAYQVQEIVPLGLAMLVGGALSYWFVKDPTSTPVVDQSAAAPVSAGQTSVDQPGRAFLTMEKLLILISVESTLVMIISAIRDAVRDRSRGSLDSGDGWNIVVVLLLLFLFAVPIYNYRSASAKGVVNRDKYAINRVVSGLTIAFGAFVLNVLFFVDLIEPALGFIVGPLMVPLVLIAGVMGFVNLLLGIINNPHRHQPLR